MPEEFDIDKEHIGDCLMTPEYAKDIFDYLKNREVGFVAWDVTHSDGNVKAGNTLDDLVKALFAVVEMAETH